MAIDERILRMSKRELRERVQQLEMEQAAPIVFVGRLLDYSMSMESDYFGGGKSTLELTIDLDSHKIPVMIMQHGKYKVTQKYQIIIKELSHDQ